MSTATSNFDFCLIDQFPPELLEVKPGRLSQEWTQILFQILLELGILHAECRSVVAYRQHRRSAKVLRRSKISKDVGAECRHVYTAVRPVAERLRRRR